MDTHIWNASPLANTVPRLLQVDQPFTSYVSDNDKGVSLFAGEFCKNVVGFPWKRNAAAPGFAVGKFQVVGRNIVPPQRQDFTMSASCVDQQQDR